MLRGGHSYPIAAEVSIKTVAVKPAPIVRAALLWRRALRAPMADMLLLLFKRRASMLQSVVLFRACEMDPGFGTMCLVGRGRSVARRSG